MAAVRAMTPADVDWAVGVLALRRAALVPHAPLYWRPAAGATRRHAEFLAHVLGEGGGVGARTDDDVMIAVPGREGWTVDDAWVRPDRWEREGLELWTRIAAEIGSEPARMVCPVVEPKRAEFAGRRGLVETSSWWHAEVGGPAGERPDEEIGEETGDGAGEGGPVLAGASVVLVPAPPVYDPGGPVTFVHEVRDPTVIARSRAEAARWGSPLVVVEQPAGADDLGRALLESGFVRHCDFLARPVGATRSRGGGGVG